MLEIGFMIIYYCSCYVYLHNKMKNLGSLEMLL